MLSSYLISTSQLMEPSPFHLSKLSCLHLNNCACFVLIPTSYLLPARSTGSKTLFLFRKDYISKKKGKLACALKLSLHFLPFMYDMLRYCSTWRLGLHIKIGILNLGKSV